MIQDPKDYDDLDDELDDELDDDSNEADKPYKETSDDQQDSEMDIDADIDIDFGSEDDEDIVIEITDEEVDINVYASDKEVTDEVEIIYNDGDISKHKEYGKHSLKYDTIFKGKKQKESEDEQLTEIDDYYHNDNYQVDVSSNYHEESINNENYIRSKLLKERVYDVLVKNTDINFHTSRRKPAKNDFNHYFFLLKQHLYKESFTNVELFNELSVYFSDNLFNMFKLLENNYKNAIIKELQEHIGKNGNTKEVKNRNIYNGTEIEFLENDKHITGVVEECFYEESKFRVNSYENIYIVELSSITKILNNKFKYNMNKLNNIDFL